jgi:hypothetical protein
MFKLKRQPHASKGQALVEFALIAVVLLMIMFLIIEAARILWAWATVQNAAREGARYAITGRFDAPDCAVGDLDKFIDQCDDLRVASIISRTHTGLTGLPLNETTGIFEDNNYYNIEVWGVKDFEIRPDFGGAPGEPVIVRAYYRVPIITPFFSPILPSIPVFGQVTMINESFGQLGGSSQGAGMPPPLPALPTAGVTPSPTPSPTNTNTPEFTLTPTPRATNTVTVTPDICGVRFEGPAIAGNNYVYVTGEVGSIVRVVNLSTGAILSGQYTLIERDGHLCPGFVTVLLNDVLVAGQGIAVESSDGSTDITFVLPGTPTPTTTSTAEFTPTATNIPPTETPTYTPTPTFPYITVLPSCGAPNPPVPGTTAPVQFTVTGVNWTVGQDVVLYWNGQFLVTASGHDGFFTYQLQRNVTMPPSGQHTDYSIRAVSASASYTVIFRVPCDSATPVPTVAQISPTPAPADLIIVGAPEIISTPPIVAYRPVQYRVVISNTGTININNQFFVDLFLDPPMTVEPNMVRIPIGYSSGYVGVSSLPGEATRVLTITAPFGFANEPSPHLIYGMVDSIEQIDEPIETNNISAAAMADFVTPGATPTPTATPLSGGSNRIFGTVSYTSDDGLDPLQRPTVYLLRDGALVAAYSEVRVDGFYEFNNVPDGTYSIQACGNLDGFEYFGIRTGITVPNALPVVNIFTNRVPCP